MKHFLFILPLVLFLNSHSQNFIPVDTLSYIPEELISVIKEEIETVYQVDFTGDSKTDYLVEAKEKKDYWYNEYWVTSDLKILKVKRRYLGGIQFFWFVNLDNDSTAEIYSAMGYEDGIDYALYDLNIDNGEEVLLFYLNPIILGAGDLNHYWGYPWDIHDIIAKNIKGEMRILASIDHEILREYSNIAKPDNQPIFPCILYEGEPTQQQLSEKIPNVKWYSIEQLVKAVHSK